MRDEIVEFEDGYAYVLVDKDNYIQQWKKFVYDERMLNDGGEVNGKR